MDLGPRAVVGGVVDIAPVDEAHTRLFRLSQISQKRAKLREGRTGKLSSGCEISWWKMKTVEEIG